MPVRPEAAHRRLDDDREEDKAPDGPGPDRQVMRLVQDEVLPDSAERLERRRAEEEAVAGVVRDAPDRHCPLIRVREVEEGPFDPASARGREAGRPSHDGGVSEGQEDVLDEVWWQEAVRVDEQERVPGCRCGTAVPALPRPAALPLQDGGPRRAGDVPVPSELPESATITSSGGTVWRRSDSNRAGRYFASFQVGTMTEIRGAASRPTAAWARAGSAMVVTRPRGDRTPARGAACTVRPNTGGRFPGRPRASRRVRAGSGGSRPRSPAHRSARRGRRSRPRARTPGSRGSSRRRPAAPTRGPPGRRAPGSRTSMRSRTRPPPRSTSAGPRPGRSR